LAWIEPDLTINNPTYQLKRIAQPNPPRSNFVVPAILTASKNKEDGTTT